MKNDTTTLGVRFWNFEYCPYMSYW